MMSYENDDEMEEEKQKAYLALTCVSADPITSGQLFWHKNAAPVMSQVTTRDQISLTCSLCQ